MKNSNNVFVLDGTFEPFEIDNDKFDAEKEAFNIAVGLTGVPNPNWTQIEWEAIFSNLIDILKDKVDARMKRKREHRYYTTVGAAVIQTIVYDCGYTDTQLIRNNNHTIIHVW